MNAILLQRDDVRLEPGKDLVELQEVPPEGGVGPVAEDAVRVRADEVGLLGVEVCRLDELGREEVLEVAQQAPVLHEPFKQSISVSLIPFRSCPVETVYRIPGYGVNPDLG